VDGADRRPRLRDGFPIKQKDNDRSDGETKFFERSVTSNRIDESEHCRYLHIVRDWSTAKLKEVNLKLRET